MPFNREETSSQFLSGNNDRHSDDMKDIITAVPSWLLKWGITLFFCVIALIVCLSTLIHYPDIVKEQLKIESPNAPKPVVSKISGKIIKLLTAENTLVIPGQPLAYIESTADHEEVLLLLSSLMKMQTQLNQAGALYDPSFNFKNNERYGELQAAYELFYAQYLTFKSSVNNGFLMKKKFYLQKDLDFLSQQKRQLTTEKIVQERDFNLATDEYKMHSKLAAEKVETNSELRQEESKYLAKKLPLIQTEAALINGENNYLSKQKDILELENQLVEERSKFIQAINSMISLAEDWKSKYVLSATQKGKLSFVGVVQENQVLAPNQEVFYINPGNDFFFGEMAITQNYMGKVKEGQTVLVKLRSYPFEEYGMIRGKIKLISEISNKDSVFISRVELITRDNSFLKKPIHLKQGMQADAEIITQDATVFQRITRSLFKIIDSR